MASSWFDTSPQMLALRAPDPRLLVLAALVLALVACLAPEPAHAAEAPDAVEVSP